jgi:hypothetical protein
MSDKHNQTPDNRKGPGNDQIIAVAFQYSLIAIALLVVLVMAVVLWQRLSQDEAPEVVAAEQADLSTLLAPAPTSAAPPAVFVDLAASAGVDFRHVNGAFGDRMLPETMGGGVAVLDYNDDGHQDLLFVNSDLWPFAPDYAESARPSGLRLFANDGRAQFRDVSTEAGLADVHLYGMGAAVADIDGDGDTDIFVTAVGENRLLENRDGRFFDVTEQAGVAGEKDSWSSSAAWFDADADGDLDLFVVNYVRWSREIDIAVDYRLTGIGRAYGPPTNFQGTQSYFYRNEGDGRFTEIGEQAGVQVNHAATGEAVGKGLALIPSDLDGDGYLDVIVANDTVRNFVFHNQGDGRFREVGIDWGLGFDNNGMATGAMGIDAVRFANDERLAVAIGNFANEMTSFYVGLLGSTQFADQAILQGIGAPTRLALTFGVVFFDYDLDGRLDFLQSNGHVENAINQVQGSQQYRQPAQLFWQCGEDCQSRFALAPLAAGSDLATPIVGRGAAYGDFNNDGRLDLVLTQVGGPPLVLQNQLETGHHWLRIKLHGRAPNTQAIGARVELQAGGVSQFRTVMPTRSYLSQVELPLTFGLGNIEQVERLIITWPDGSRQQVDNPAVDQTLVIRRDEA